MSVADKLKTILMDEVQKGETDAKALVHKAEALAETVIQKVESSLQKDFLNFVARFEAEAKAKAAEADAYAEQLLHVKDLMTKAREAEQNAATLAAGLRNLLSPPAAPAEAPAPAAVDTNAALAAVAAAVGVAAAPSLATPAAAPTQPQA